MKDFVVYTVLTGGYDNITQPLVVDDRFDYILFTDVVTSPKIGVWEVRAIKYQDKDFVRVSRYPKINIDKVLPEYKASLYHDANIQIKTQLVYDRIIELYNEGVDWAGMNHPFHDCLYDELWLVTRKGFERDMVTFCLGHKLRKECFPQHIGFYENSIIFRINSPLVKEIDEMWWSYVKTLSRRDQLSLRYILWKNSYTLKYIFPSNQSTRNSPNFIYIPHDNSVNKRKVLKISIIGYIRQRIRDIKGDKEKKTYFALYRCPFPKVTLLFWELINIFTCYLPHYLKKKFFV